MQKDMDMEQSAEMQGFTNDRSVTPTEKMMGDINQLKDIGDVSALSEEQKKEFGDKIASMVDSVLFGLNNMSFEEMKNKYEILNQLKDKGFSQVEEGLKKMNEMTNGKLEAPLELNQEQTENVIARDEEVSHDFKVTENENSQTQQDTEGHTFEGAANDDVVNSDSAAKGAVPAAQAKGLAPQTKGFALQSNLVEPPTIPQARAVPKDGSVEAFMARKYGANHTEGQAMNPLLKDRNEGR